MQVIDCQIRYVIAVSRFSLAWNKNIGIYIEPVFLSIGITLNLVRRALGEKSITLLMQGSQCKTNGIKCFVNHRLYFELDIKLKS